MLDFLHSENLVQAVSANFESLIFTTLFFFLVILHFLQIATRKSDSQLSPEQEKKLLLVTQQLEEIQRSCCELRDLADKFDDRIRGVSAMDIKCEQEKSEKILEFMELELDTMSSSIDDINARLREQWINALQSTEQVECIESVQEVDEDLGVAPNCPEIQDTFQLDSQSDPSSLTNEVAIVSSDDGCGETTGHDRTAKGRRTRRSFNGAEKKGMKTMITKLARSTKSSVSRRHPEQRRSMT